MPPQTAISPPVGTYALIFYSHWGNALHWGLPPAANPPRTGVWPLPAPHRRRNRLALGSGTDVKSQSDFLVRP